MINATVAGHLGADPELRNVGQSQALNLRIASKSREKQDGAWQNVTTWVGATVWGKRAQGLADILRKGSYVVVSGSLRLREYTGRDGDKRTSVELDDCRAELGPKRDNAAQSAPASPPHQDLPPEAMGDDDDIPF